MLKMEKILLVVPILTFFANLAILLNIPLFREIIVFIFLSFIPGFALLRLFKLKEMNSLETVFFSVALSIAFVMFIGLLFNELYQFIGVSNSLSAIPIIASTSVFTLAAFFIDYKHNSKENLNETVHLGELKTVLPMLLLLLILPIFTAISVLFYDITAILIADVILAALCVLAVVSPRIVPQKLFPFLILSISVVLVCQVLLTSQYILGYDANTEYYVFRLTQLNGHWAPLDPVVYSLEWQNYNLMLSITILPTVYSTLMHAAPGIIFKMLYPFLICFIPLVLYRICEEQFGKLTGVLSTFFFIFTSAAFYGLEPLSLNRQIVGGLFFLLSIFLLVNKTLPVTKRRILLMIFGAALAVSHYTLAYILLGFVTLVFILSKIKPRFGDTLNNATMFFLFVITFSWYAIGPGSPLISLTNTIRITYIELATGLLPSGAVTPSYLFFAPTAYTVATWFNVLVTGAVNILLLVGVLVLLLRPKETRIFPQYRVLMAICAFLLLISFVAPSFASGINFTRFYSITLLFLAPAVVLGGQVLLATIAKTWTRVRQSSNRRLNLKIKSVDISSILIAILLSGYLLSQVGFVNYVTNSDIHSYSTDFQRMLKSNETKIKFDFYGVYLPEQDVFSASWLLDHKAETALVYNDYGHALVSYGLVPNYLLVSITNTTIPTQGSLVYFRTLNVVNDIVITSYGYDNTSDFSFLFDQSNLVYSNDNSVVWYVPS